MNTALQAIYGSDNVVAFADLARNLARGKLLEELEVNDSFPFSPVNERVILQFGELGFYGINVPEPAGGIGGGAGALSVILDHISRTDAGFAALLFTNAAAVNIINEASRDSDCAEVYREISVEPLLPVAFMSYADPSETEMPVAETEAERLFISGRADFLVCGNVARYGVIPARENNSGGYSYCLVDLLHEQVHLSEPILTLGMRDCPVADATLAGVPARLLGKPGMGETYFKKTQALLSVGAMAILAGIMRSSLDTALEYARDRYQGGKMIIDWDEVRMLLARFFLDLTVVESLLSCSIEQADSSITGWEHTALAGALHAGELACRATSDGVQILGGNGYMKDYFQEKRMRDARQARSLLGMAPLRTIKFLNTMLERG